MQRRWPRRIVGVLKNELSWRSSRGELCDQSIENFASVSLHPRSTRIGRSINARIRIGNEIERRIEARIVIRRSRDRLVLWRGAIKGDGRARRQRRWNDAHRGLRHLSRSVLFDQNIRRRVVAERRGLVDHGNYVRRRRQHPAPEDPQTRAIRLVVFAQRWMEGCTRDTRYAHFVNGAAESITGGGRSKPNAIGRRNCTECIYGLRLALNAVDEKPGALACAVDDSRDVMEAAVRDPDIGEDSNLVCTVAQSEEHVRIKAARVDDAERPAGVYSSRLRSRSHAGRRSRAALRRLEYQERRTPRSLHRRSPQYRILTRGRR